MRFARDGDPFLLKIGDKWLCYSAHLPPELINPGVSELALTRLGSHQIGSTVDTLETAYLVLRQRQGRAETFERVGRAMYLRIHLRDRAAVAFMIDNAVEEGLEVV